MFMKRIASLVISLTMIVSLSSNMALAVDTKIAEANGAGESQAVLTQQPTLMNVRVPTQLPVDIDKDGNVAVATDSSIVNNGVGPISVKSVTVKPLGAWQLAEYTKDFKSEKVGLKEFGMVLNSDLVQTDGSLTLTPASWVNVAGGRVLPITYNANVATQKDLINETIANVVFVIGWATNGEIPSKSEIHSLRVQSAPTSVVYNVGDAIDLTGLSLYAVYLDGTSREITNYRVLNGSRLTANQKSVDIEYMDSGKLVTTSINITVNNPVTSISITKSPSKVDYIAGETFDTTGMEITATYTNGDTAVISGYTVEDGEALSIEKSLVTISYIDNGKTVKVTQPITVTNPLVSIAVTKAPSKTTYTVGENFETVGLEVTATYTNGSTAVVSGYSILDGAGLPEGKTSITISYTEDGKVTTTTQPINISNPLVSIAVTKAPYKVNYIAGESFAVGGLEITATYTNGRKAVVTDYTVTDGTSLIKGKSSVTISYTENGKVVTAVQVISVTNPVESIAVTKAPSKVKYIEGESFSAIGLEVTATYANGQKAVITSYSIQNKESLQLDRKSVTITYAEDGKTVTTIQPITVVRSDLVSIVVKTPPTKVEYRIGEDFNPAGMQIQANYSNGTNKIVPNFVVSNGTNLPKGNNSIKISYTEGSITKEVYQSVVADDTMTLFRYSDGSSQVIEIVGTLSKSSYTVPSGVNLISVEIGRHVTTIGDLAFDACSSLTSVQIPDSVNTLGNTVFRNCNSLASISIPSSVTVLGDQVFYKCTSLASISIPVGLTTIGSGAFYRCTSLNSVSIPSSITTISEQAFCNCTSLTSVQIPSSVKTIGSIAFYNVPHIEYHGTASGNPWGAKSMN